MENQNEKSLGYSWFVVFVLMLANVSSFLDRQILSLLVGPIKRDLHLSDTQMSLLMGLSFALFYTLFGVFIGFLADKHNRRNIIAIGIAVWSLMTAMCAGVSSYSQFFLARMGVGVGEATLAPSAYSMIADYFPKNKLATALSTYSIGIFLGAGMALLIGAALISQLPTTGMVHVPVFGDIFPWQMLFIYIGLPGLVIAALVLILKEPARKDDKSNAETPLSISEVLSIILEKKAAYLYITLGATFCAFGSYGSTAWIPTYFNRTFGWATREIGFKYGLIVMIFSVLGVFVGGWLADRYNQSGKIDGKIRVGLISAIGLLASSFNFMLSDPNMILLSLSVPAFFLSFAFGASVAAIQEIMPNRARGLASAIFLFILNLIALAGGPFIVAFFTDSIFHNESMIKYSLVALYLIGGGLSSLFYWLAFKPYRELVKN